MLANMKAKKYCVHPGRLRVKVPERKLRADGEQGEPTGKSIGAWKYFSANDLIEAYGLDKELCVTWGKECVGVDHLIHLYPDKEGRYELPEHPSVIYSDPEVVEAPRGRYKPRKAKR